MNVVALLDAAVVANATRFAIVEEKTGQRVTYAQLHARAARAARVLTTSGLPTGARIVVGIPMSVDLYVALLAIWRAGMVAVVPDASSGLAALFASVERAQAHAIVLPQRFAVFAVVVPALRALSQRFSFGAFPTFVDLAAGAESDTANHGACAAGTAVAEQPANAPALLSFTSGSTGEPKIVVRTHGILHAQVSAILANTRLGQTALETMPIVLFANLAAGGTSAIPDANLSAVGRIDGDRLCRTIQRYRCATLVASPVVLDRIAAAAGGLRDNRLDSLTDVYSGGAPVFVRTLDAFVSAAPEATLWAVYGSTEAEPIAHLDRADIGPEDRWKMQHGAGVLAGRCVAQTQLAILKRRPGQPLGPWSSAVFAAAHVDAGDVGEIVVAGAHVVTTYDRGIGNAETKIDVAGTVWHRTGDLGRIDARGRLWLLGRDRAAIIDDRGVAYPLAAECALSFQPAVRRSALVQYARRRVLVVESEQQQTVPAPRGVDVVVNLKRIPVDRRHNAKTDYPALVKTLAKHKELAAASDPPD